MQRIRGIFLITDRTGIVPKQNPSWETRMGRISAEIRIQINKDTDSKGKAGTWVAIDVYNVIALTQQKDYHLIRFLMTGQLHTTIKH